MTYQSTILPTAIPDRHPPELVLTRPLVEVCDLTGPVGQVPTVEQVCLELYAGEVLGILGGAHAGKSALLHVLALEDPPTTGRYVLNIPGYRDLNLFALDQRLQEEVRFYEIGLVHQYPQQGLDMQRTSGEHITEQLRLAGEQHADAQLAAAYATLALVEFPLDQINELPARLPLELQRRVQLAQALTLRPTLLLLDEPTSGLDLLARVRLLDTLRRLHHTLHTATIITSQNLGVLRLLADRLVVLQRGSMVEQGLVDQILEDPQHPYTQQLVLARL
ncbi:MAG: ATP-binding cassette domain-containing protein [Chloroflexaceae bacterium]|nr:ATP-binding cassette domain-containing protein [Chloroflexaceae bacterium]NJO06960.1 ATP-binding cassette domain-containing protein [Chloroflexaceae bacterium]